MFSLLLQIALTGFLFSSAALGGSPEFQVHDGDTVVFYGDSITNQRLYTVFTEAYVLTRFPHIHVTFVHSGSSGDRVSGGANGPIDLRLERDVFAHHATVITVMLGMNDGEYRPFEIDLFNKFTTGYRHILDAIHSEAPNARVTLLEPSPYDDFTRSPKFAGGYNSVLLKYGKFVREIGAAHGLTVANLNAPVVAFLKTANTASRELAQTLIEDRVHPSPGVHLVMAEALLSAWHAPALISSVGIDASTGAVHAENTAVESLELQGELSWTQLDNALPMPVEVDDETLGLALRYSDFTDSLNQEVLKITGLRPGSYRLQIDDELVATLPAWQLARGINLAVLKTPMARQAQIVLDLTYRHNHLRFARVMMVENALKEYRPTELQAAIDAMDSLREEIVSLQRSAAIPKPHRYRLTADHIR
jgi:lysophospholipase L1-like esterase